MYKVTYTFKDGSYLMVLFDEDEGEGLYEGVWKEPFPNTAKDSLAFGLVETFEQGEVGPLLTERHGSVVRLEIRKNK